MNFLSEEKVEFSDPNAPTLDSQTGQFVEFITSSTAGVYAIILKNDNTIAVVPYYNVKFIGL